MDISGVAPVKEKEDKVHWLILSNLVLILIH